jgi:hypothetical protein
VAGYVGYSSLFDESTETAVVNLSLKISATDSKQTEKNSKHRDKYFFPTSARGTMVQMYI